MQYWDLDLVAESTGPGKNLGPWPPGLTLGCVCSNFPRNCVEVKVVTPAGGDIFNQLLNY